MKKNVQTNSLLAFDSIEDTRSTRELLIYEKMSNMARPMSDREVMHALGFTDPNAVRPRISSLIEGHWLVYGPDVECPVTHKRVRRTYALSPGERQSAIATLRAKWTERHVVTAQPELFESIA